MIKKTLKCHNFYTKECILLVSIEKNSIPHTHTKKKKKKKIPWKQKLKAEMVLNYTEKEKINV